MDADEEKPVLSTTEFINKIGASVDQTGAIVFDEKKNEVISVCKIGSTYYILTAPYPEITYKTNFFNDPKKYCTYVLYDESDEVVRLIMEQNLQNTDKQIAYKAQEIGLSIWDIIMPIVYVLMFIFFLIFLFKGIGGRNGITGMSKNRATLVFNSPIRFADVAGIEEEKEQVAEIVDFLKFPKKYLDMGARIPKGILLVGQPGTGKTLLAKAIAGEAGVPFFSISGSDFSEMLVGVGPSRMRDLFEQAKFSAPSIIFFDEIDSIAKMRGVGVSGVSEENEQTLNQLLVQMDGFSKSDGVIILGATNRPDVLDPALLRPGRFDRQIIVQMPDVKGREQILSVHANGKPFGKDVDFLRVAKITSGFSGADIENLLNESAIIAAKDGRTFISMSDVMEGINKVLMGPQKKSRIITEQDKKITAFHEAGHAVVSRILMPEQTVQEVSIIPRGMAAGYTLTNDQDNEHSHQSRGELKNKLVMLLGGRAAEEIFIKDICTGASNDIKVATKIAEKMVTEWGMSEKLGPLFYGKSDEAALRLYNDKHTSESLQSIIDGEVKALIMAAKVECEKILSREKSKVEVMAKVLLEAETIYADEIAMIMNGETEKKVLLKTIARQKIEDDANKRNKVDSLLKELENRIKLSEETARTFLDAKLISEENFKKMKENFEIARKYVALHVKLPPVPTLDNLDNYDILDEKKEEAEKEKGSKNTGKKAAKGRQKGKGAESKKVKKGKSNGDKEVSKK
jgi:cell division protease FtsH